MATDFQINGKSFDDFFIPRDLFSQGGLWGWGYNNVGQLGDNTSTQKSSPIQTISGGTNWKQVSVGDHAAAIKTDGTLWLWGRNTYGQLGNNLGGGAALDPKSSPVQTISGGTNWKMVACGGYNTACIKTDGTLWLWGYNTLGQLGNNANTINETKSPVQTVSGGANWKQVSTGNFSAAIKTDGTLWTWGYNVNGTLGDNTTVNKSSPVQTVAGGTNWKQVSSGGSHNAAAIKTDGTLWTWGINSYGNLGNNTNGNGGTTNSQSSPIQTISGGTNWKMVACGYYHDVAIKTDGTLWTWGYGYYGQLGNETNLYSGSRSSPVQTVAGGTNWKQVSSDSNHTTCIKTDGTLWTWGENSFVQLGDNTTVNKSSPVQTVAGGTNWKQVDAGSISMMAIREDFY
tara:strand:- start:6211 stop:7407 length:1197 start_codon:yes stop_codon:yes gene_type:complete